MPQSQKDMTGHSQAIASDNKWNKYLNTWWGLETERKAKMQTYIYHLKQPSQAFIEFRILKNILISQ